MTFTSKVWAALRWRLRVGVGDTSMAFASSGAGFVDGGESCLRVAGRVVLRLLFDGGRVA